jgi:uncharacterized protein (TIGR02118 family)
MLDICCAGPSAVDMVADAPPRLAGAHAYRVEERRLKTYARTWPDGEATPGVFLVSPVRRAKAIDAAGFDAYWRDRHGPLALVHHAGMWDYRQAVVVERLTEGAPPYDGIARLGFRTLRDLETGLFATRESRRVIGEDTARFVNVEHLEVALLREIVVKS